MKRILKYGLYTIISVFLLLNIVVAFHAYKFTHFYDDIPAPMKGSMEMSVSEKFGAILFGLDVPKSKDTLTADGSFQPVLLKTDEGLLIKAWLASADSSKGTVILFHGHGSSASKMTPEAMAFKAMGYSVMLVDFRAHGNSEGNTCTIGYTETEEVKLAYNNIRQRNEKNIILWGISMGAATVCAAVPQYGLKPQKIILEMPFGTLHEAAGDALE